MVANFLGPISIFFSPCLYYVFIQDSLIYHHYHGSVWLMFIFLKRIEWCNVLKWCCEEKIYIQSTNFSPSRVQNLLKVQHWHILCLWLLVSFSWDIYHRKPQGFLKLQHPKCLVYYFFFVIPNPQPIFNLNKDK